MRFKAKLAPEQVSLLYSLVTPLAKLSGSNSKSNTDNSTWLNSNGSILYLDSQHVRLSVAARQADAADGIACFAELKAAGGIFLEHRIESAAEHNAILMELDLGQLKVALQSLVTPLHNSTKQQHHHSAAADPTLTRRLVSLKLAKRHQNIPCLCLEGSAGLEVVHHAIPVRILRATELHQHLPPVIQAPTTQQVSITPFLSQLRTVLERMRALAPRAAVRVQAGGSSSSSQQQLKLSLDSEGTSLQIFFGGHHHESSSASEEEKSCTTTVKVSCAKLCQALAWQHVVVCSTALLCLAAQECFLVVHVTLQPAVVGFFTYYVPIQYMSSSDDDADPDADADADE